MGIYSLPAINTVTISGGTANIYGVQTSLSLASLTVQNSPIINYYGYWVSNLPNLGTTGTVTKYGGYFNAAGTADTNYGIYADATAATTNYGLYAVITDSNTAGYGIFVDMNENDTDDYGLYIDSESTAWGGGIYVLDGSNYFAEETFFNASTTVNSRFRVDGNATTTGNTYLGTDSNNFIWLDDGQVDSAGTAAATSSQIIFDANAYAAVIPADQKYHLMAAAGESAAWSPFLTVNLSSSQNGVNELYMFSVLEGTGIAVGMGSGADDDAIYFDTWGASAIGSSGLESLIWDDNPGEFDVSDDLNVTGRVTSTVAIWAGTAGTANNLDLTGGDVYIQDDIEIDDDIYLPNMEYASGGSGNVYWDASNGKLYQTTGGASPYLISLDGIPLAEVLAEQWKIEANSVNRIDGYDGTTDPAFVLGSFKEKETDYIDSISMQLRCKNNKVIDTKEYPLTFISKFDQQPQDEWIAAAAIKDGQYLQSEEGDLIIVAFEKPLPEDYANCEKYDFAFVAYGYYEWERPEFDANRIQKFWEKYAAYLFEPIKLIGDTFFTMADWLVDLFNNAGSDNQTQVVKTQGPTIDELISSHSQVGLNIPVELWAKVTDPDTAEEDLIYSWSFSPNLGSLSGNSGLVYWTVGQAEHDTDVTVTVTVSDGTNSDSSSIVVKVIAPNQESGSEEPEEETPTSTDPVVIPGCTDQNALNYQPEATQDDGSCIYEEGPIEEPEPVIVLGCMDQNALNYNSDASYDDGSCEYNQEPIVEEPTSTSTEEIVQGEDSDSGQGGGEVEASVTP